MTGAPCEQKRCEPHRGDRNSSNGERWRDRPATEREWQRCRSGKWCPRNQSETSAGIGNKLLGSLRRRPQWPNDPKLSDCGGRRSLCGKAAGAGLQVEAQAVTPGAVRCSAWFGDVGVIGTPSEKNVQQRMQPT
jgi:hypothetical protein